MTKQATGKENKKGGKKAKKPNSFERFWSRLLRKDKKKGSTDSMPTERTVKRAVAKVAKNLHLKKQEQKKVTSVLAAELQRRAQEKAEAPHHALTRPEAGAAVFPVRVQEGLFDQRAGSATEAEPAVVALDQPIPKQGASDLEMQRKSFLEKSGAAGSTSGGKSGRSGQSWSQEAYGQQPTSITLDDAAVKEIKGHLMFNMLKDLLVEASIRAPPPNKKAPEDMNPEELVDLRRQQPKEWDRVSKENTVVSFAMSKPGPDDLNHAKKTKEKARPKRLQFDPKVDVAKAPVGKDFDMNEKKGTASGSLKKP